AAAAEAGAGLALLPHFIGRARLQRCALGPEPPVRELWSVIRRHDAKDPAIRLVVDFLAQLFRDQRALFED
ncbi:MAG TPA: LysR substrate-binding domain-containing protein, partial [Rhizomicrobium sp.]|nr:LysR substrate-binding domain-containing protein [Rhizomicrobium sp.]